MKEQGRGGCIVIIGSIMADFCQPTSACVYSMGKCAIRQLGKVAAAELACENIRVNVIQPGYIDTPGERRVATEEELRNSAKCIPLQRLGQPADIGNMASYLCSPAGSYVTGSVFDVDGGFKVNLALPGHTQERGEEQGKLAAQQG